MVEKEELGEGLTPRAGKLYEQLKANRSPFLMRARDCAKYTIPTLIPPFDGSNKTGAIYYPTPWQSMGARGVNNLAAKLLMALFPPNTPFFKLEIDDQTLAELAGSPDMQSKVLEGLNKIERAVQTNIEQGAVRISAFGTGGAGGAGGGAGGGVGGGLDPPPIHIKQLLSRNNSWLVIQ